ncbi:hypothetical protein HPB47_014305 [Ixodes persulcatus]|uniref:Uncharacterized protein n=1 Tax=Ixodes persulcatus TaxID=34615 RepID=A0AC60QXP0_IXOPE|nr:hypothetical protein HPB47_014305 [Ixodes persulcatus]
MHPYSIVEESGFVEMMKLAMPDYTVPSRTTFSRAVIPDLYESKKKELKKSLRDIFSSGAECYSITTDGWTSCANDSYVSVTCHVMDKEFGQHVHALACTDMTDSHTAENLEQFIKSAIEDWELPAPGTMPIYVVTDNARNFTSAFARSPWSGVQCFGHTLQLCISNAKKKVAGFSQLCAKARTIVARYKRSAKTRGRLMEIQKNMNLEPLEVVQDVPTHWNSEHAMMKRLVKLRVPVSVELSECDTVEPLSASEWRIMTAVVQVLQPLEQATAELSGDSYPTLSQVIPLLECTKVVLSRHSTDEAGSAVEESASVDDPSDAAAETSGGIGDSLGDTLWDVFCSLSSDTHQKPGHEFATESVEYLKTPLLARTEDPLACADRRSLRRRSRMPLFQEALFKVVAAPTTSSLDSSRSTDTNHHQTRLLRPTERLALQRSSPSPLLTSTRLKVLSKPDAAAVSKGEEGFSPTAGHRRVGAWRCPPLVTWYARAPPPCVAAAAKSRRRRTLSIVRRRFNAFLHAAVAAAAQVCLLRGAAVVI